MAIIRKCKLSWAASDDEDVVGYKIYWAYGLVVSYDSESFEVGKVTESTIPDDISFLDGPVMFGITAIDRDGNESDMTTATEPFQPCIPEAPRALTLTSADAFAIIEDPQTEIFEIEAIRGLVAQLEANRASSNAEDSYAADDQPEDDTPAQFDIGSIF